MQHFWHSIRTWAYWRYAIFSLDALKTFFAVLGGYWLLVEFLSYFGVIDTKAEILSKYGPWIALSISLLAIAVVLISRRPVKRIICPIKKKELKIEVRIGDIFDCNGERVISTNTTFDTDTSNGLISPHSLQGIFTQRFFANNLSGLDSEIDTALENENSETVDNLKGKNKRYPLGTVAKLPLCNEHYYLLAMAHMNEDGNAYSTPRMLEEALDGLWKFMKQRGELGTIVVPLMGTGRGRVRKNRKEIISMIASSFLEAAQDNVFSHKLVIVIHPSDYREHNLNLFEVRDFLGHTLG